MRPTRGQPPPPRPPSYGIGTHRGGTGLRLLEKRIAEADKVIPTVTSKAMQQDLETEKARIGQRLSDLATRHDFLSKEKERFSI